MMPSKPEFGISTIREAARHRAEETSGRATAEEIGMSATAFRHFLEGGKPHPETRRKLVAWFGRWAVRGTFTNGADVEAALDLLGTYLADSSTSDIRAKRRAYIDRRLDDSAR